MKTLTMESIKFDVESLDKKIERLKTSLAAATSQRAALMLVIDRYTEKTNKPVMRNENPGIDPDELRGMKMEEALIRIAENNGGHLNSTTARALLQEAGVLTGSQCGHTLWNALQSSEHFEKVGRGKVHAD